MPTRYAVEPAGAVSSSVLTWVVVRGTIEVQVN